MTNIAQLHRNYQINRHTKFMGMYNLALFGNKLKTYAPEFFSFFNAIKSEKFALRIQDVPRNMTVGDIV